MGPPLRSGRTLVIALLASGLAVGLVGRRVQAGPVRSFETHLLKAPGRVLDIAHADVDGDGKEDLIVTHLDGDGTTRDARGAPFRYVSVWLQKEKGSPWNSLPDVTRPVPDEAVAFAAGDFDPAPGAEIAFLGADGVTLLRRGPSGALLGDMAIVTTGQSFFDYPAAGVLPRWDLACDLGSKRLDLLVPVRDGYQVLRNEAGKGLVVRGRVKVPSTERFGPAFETKFLNRFLTYVANLPRLVPIDVDACGRMDLVAYRKKGLARFLQRPDGTFPETPDDEKPLGVVQEAEKVAKKKEGPGGAKSGGEAFSNVRVSLVDLNHDRYADLVATKTVGEIGVFETLRTQILICMGSKSGWNEASPDRILNEKGVATDPEFLDLDGDGLLDLVVSSIRMDHFTNLKRAITKSITITYSVYLQKKDGFPEEPDYTSDVDVDIDALETRNGADHASFAPDLNGDGFHDMLVRSARDKLRVLWGGVEKGWFSGKKIAWKDDDTAVELAIPANADVEIADLYHDRKGEALILTNPAADDPERAAVRIIEARR
jgi:hypothetical protein